MTSVNYKNDIHSYDLVNGTNKIALAGKTILMIRMFQNKLGMPDMLWIPDAYYL